LKYAWTGASNDHGNALAHVVDPTVDAPFFIEAYCRRISTNECLSLTSDIVTSTRRDSQRIKRATTTMVDVFLVVSIVVTFFLLFVAAVYLLVYYQHPDDKNDSYFPKAVVIGGIILAVATTLLLPLDVANNEGYAGMYGNFVLDDGSHLSHES